MAVKGRILIVDDEKDIRFLIREILEDEGHTVSEAPHSEAAFAHIATHGVPDLVILDIWLENSDMDGMEILAELRKKTPSPPVLMISGHGNIEMAVKAIKLGAYDFIEKPFNTDRLLILVNRALESGRLRRQGPAAGLHMVATSPEMQAVAKTAQKAAQGDTRVLVTGPWGSGRSFMARWIHQESSRVGKPVVTVASGSLHTEGVLSSFEQAKDGTLILEDIHSLAGDAQTALLQRLATPVKTDPRLISTGSDNADDLRAVRPDLLDRLGVTAIALPPLKNRRADIVPMAEAFASECFCQWNRAEGVRLAPEAETLLMRHDWPGEAVELKAVIQLAAIRMAMENVSVMTPAHISLQSGGSVSAQGGAASPNDSWASLDLRTAREAFERWYFEIQLERFSGNISQMANFVGMDRTALHRKLKSLKDEENGPESIAS